MNWSLNWVIPILMLFFQVISFWENPFYQTMKIHYPIFHQMNLKKTTIYVYASCFSFYYHYLTLLILRRCFQIHPRLTNLIPPSCLQLPRQWNVGWMVSTWSHELPLSFWIRAYCLHFSSSASIWMPCWASPLHTNQRFHSSRPRSQNPTSQIALATPWSSYDCARSV